MVNKNLQHYEETEVVVQNQKSCLLVSLVYNDELLKKNLINRDNMISKFKNDIKNYVGYVKMTRRQKSSYTTEEEWKKAYDEIRKEALEKFGDPYADAKLESPYYEEERKEGLKYCFKFSPITHPHEAYTAYYILKHDLLNKKDEYIDLEIKRSYKKFPEGSGSDAFRKTVYKFLDRYAETVCSNK